VIEVKHHLRKAYLAKLANLNYLGVNIPLDDENLTKPEAILPIGNSVQVQSWVLIRNQDVQDSSAKCSINQDTQLQLHVITAFLAGAGSNTGNFAHADLISDEILQILFPYNNPEMDLSLPNAQLWRGYLASSRHLFEESTEERIYTNILLFNHSIKQYNLTT